MRKINVLLLAVATALAVGIGNTAAVAQPQTSVQGQITQILRQHPGGVQISPTQIAWQDGSVILNLATPTSHAASPRGGASTNVVVHNCPFGWYCFYEFANFGGRMLQLQYCPPASSSTPIFLSNYGFENLTSSYVVNRNINYLNVYEKITQSSWNYLWSEVSWESGDVWASYDNRADIVYCFG